jgi:hypothetical protein
MLTAFEIAFIISLAVLIVVVIFSAINDSPSCGGSCQQGRYPCDCKQNKDMNEG